MTIRNPECEIFADDLVFANKYGTHNTVIYGAENSTAKQYAAKYGYTFKEAGAAQTDIAQTTAAASDRKSTRLNSSHTDSSRMPFH